MSDNEDPGKPVADNPGEEIRKVDPREYMFYHYDGPFLYIPSFSEPIRKSPGRPRSERSFVQPTQKPVRSVSKQPKFFAEIPPPIVIKEEGYDPWVLRCVCGDSSITNGYLLECEKCKNWQHGICMNLNKHTTPENYQCVVCSPKPIHCKCEQNLNYRFSIIKCSQCGNYSHRRCAGLMYGPLPNKQFICSFCGKYRFTFAKTKIPTSLQFDNPSYTFSQDKIDQLHPQLLTGPFSDFLMIDVFDSTLTRREFCETLFDRFRSFYFLCHPLYPSNVSKKKRNNLLTSFLSASEFLCHNLYQMDHDLFARIFDSLLFAAIYKPHSFAPDVEQDIDFTENAMFEVQNINDTVVFPEGQIPQGGPIQEREDGLYAAANMINSQFLFLCEGYVGDLEEFDYDNGVNAAMYQIQGTRLILDATHVPNSPLHRMRRSMFGNCVLRLVKLGERSMVGLFVGRSHLTLPDAGEDPAGVGAGDELCLGIDFLPAVLEDTGKWLSWHCGDLSENSSLRPSGEDRKIMAAIRQFEKTKPSKKGRQRDDERKKSRRQRKQFAAPNDERTLFDMFESEDPGAFLFRVGDDLKALEESVRMTVVAVPVSAPRGRPRLSHARPRRAQSSPMQDEHHPGARVERAKSRGGDSDDSENEPEEDEEERHGHPPHHAARGHKRGPKPKHRPKEEEDESEAEKPPKASEEEEDHEREAENENENENENELENGNEDEKEDEDEGRFGISPRFERKLMLEVKAAQFVPSKVQNATLQMLEIMGM